MHLLAFIFLALTTANAEVPDGFHPNAKQVWVADCSGDNDKCVDLCNRIEPDAAQLCLNHCASNLLSCQKSQSN